MKPSNIIILLFAFLLASCKLPFTSNFEIDSKNSTPDNSATSNDQNDKRIIVGLKSDQEFLIEALPFNSDPEGPAPIANTLKVVSNRPALEDTVINVSYSGNFSNNDFSSMPMTVTIPKDQSEAVLQLITINDAITEPFKTIVIQLSATNPDIAFEEKDSVFEFRDDDPLSLSIAPYKVNGLITNDIGIEGAMDGIKYDVTMSSASPRVPSHDVILKLKNLTGTLSADDFVNDINTIIFPAGTGSMVFEFHVKQDSLDEGIEAATLTYELSNYAGKGRGNIVFNLRVLDDEIPSIDMKNADSCVTVNESDVRTCQILLRRSGDIADPLSIPFSFSGLATHGSDYIMSTSANFKSGEAAITVDVSFTNDTVFEDLEDAIIKTQQLQGYSCFCDTGLEFFITDDDGSPEGRSVEITGVANMLNSTITLNWPNDFDFISYKVYRRELGETSWGPVLANLPAGQQTYTDSNVISGKVYEYKVERKNGRGFTAVAFNRPEVHSRGRVLIVAESTIASQLVDEINTWKDQLVGDGWEIVYKTAAATDTVVSVKNKIASSYNEPGSLKAVILFGHIPVPYSGSMAPDGHSDHGGAWPADIYYADMDGIWTDFSVNSPGSVRPQNRNVPGDGKFDQILAPSVAEFALGRIDMANMPAFAPLTEVELLRRYLQKMTNYRTATFTPIRQGLIDDNFGDFYTEAFARGAWNWMGAIVGRDKTFARDFRSELSTQSYLWAYGCGGGTYTGAGGIGLTSEMATQPLNAVFTALFGSYFGDWDSTDNFLRSPLAADGQALMSVWAGRPNWSFHSMAAGETMTRTILQTWNQPISYYSTSHDNGVHVGFMGDPTLRDYMIKPVTNITTSGKIGNQTTLSWNHTETVTGYYIYKSASRLGPYHLINSTPVTEKSFPLILNNDDKFFMVRGVKPEDTYGGIFQNLSTGTIYELP